MRYTFSPFVIYSFCPTTPLMPAVILQEDSNGAEFTMFWFAKNIGLEETCQAAWDRMNVDEMKFIVVNADTVCGLHRNHHRSTCSLIHCASP